MTKRAFLLLLLLSCSAVPTAWAEETDLSIGLGAGLVKPEEIEATVCYGLDFRVSVAKHFALTTGMGYWRKASSVPGFASASLSTVSFDVGVVGLAPLGQRVNFEFGGGVGLYVVDGGVSFLESKFAPYVLAGVDGKVGDSASLFVQGRYDLVNDLHQFKVLGGVRFWFVL